MNDQTTPRRGRPRLRKTVTPPRVDRGLLTRAHAAAVRAGVTPRRFHESALSLLLGEAPPERDLLALPEVSADLDEKIDALAARLEP